MTEIDAAEPHLSSFEAIRREADGEEYWLARQLAPVLDYQDYRNFVAVIEKAKVACANAGFAATDHFGDVTTMVGIGSGARRELNDVRLSRYACYLIVQNGDPSKPVIAQGQTYFAVQTRRQELQDDPAFGALSEDDRRMEGRGIASRMARHVLADLKAKGLLILPTCTFFSAYLKKRPEYADQVHPTYRGMLGL